MSPWTQVNTANGASLIESRGPIANVKPTSSLLAISGWGLLRVICVRMSLCLSIKGFHIHGPGKMAQYSVRSTQTGRSCGATKQQGIHGVLAGMLDAASATSRRRRRDRSLPSHLLWIRIARGGLPTYTILIQLSCVSFKTETNLFP